MSLYEEMVTTPRWRCEDTLTSITATVTRYRLYSDTLTTIHSFKNHTKQPDQTKLSRGRSRSLNLNPLKLNYVFTHIT